MALFSISDEQAMWRVQTQEDHHAFTILVRRWEGRILRLCARMTGDVHRGEDLKQEAFARVFSKRKEYDPGRRFSTWLWQIALNLCYDELRKRSRHGETPFEQSAADLLANVEFAPEGQPDVEAAAQEENACVREAVLKLSEPLRSAVLLRFTENLKLREISEVLEIPESTVRYRLAEGLDQLSSMLRQKMGLPSASEKRKVPAAASAPGVFKPIKNCYETS